jgi:hypothetical protein
MSQLTTEDWYDQATECNLRIIEMHYQLYLAITCLCIFILLLAIVMTVPLYLAMGVGKDSRDKYFPVCNNKQ